MFEMPYGTGVCYVKMDPETSADIEMTRPSCTSSNKTILNEPYVKEKRARNFTETSESLVVQYLATWGHLRWTSSQMDFTSRCCTFPDVIASAIHSSPGQQVFGHTKQQRADLMLQFSKSHSSSEFAKSLILFHNYHGGYFHYEGHTPTCCRKAPNNDKPFNVKKDTYWNDLFRRDYAEKMSSVFPFNFKIVYSISYECDYFHGSVDHFYFPTASTTATSFTSCKFEGSMHTAINEIEQKAANIECSRHFKQPPFFNPWKFKRSYKNQQELLDDIMTRKVDGFVTISGGSETPSNNKAINNFGFCVQKFAPRLDQLSALTRAQAAMFNVSRPTATASRTMSSGAFHGDHDETLSTSYFRWLIEKRGLKDFKITHFIRYAFSDNVTKPLLLQILQRRHECKQAGKKIEAECLKLIANGSYGYSALESTNYSNTKILTNKAFAYQRKNSFADVHIKSFNLIGIVKTQQTKSKKKSSENKISFDFLYQVNYMAPKKKILNCLPRAVSVLSNSKKLFFDRIYDMLDCFDYNLVEVCYCDTGE